MMDDGHPELRVIPLDQARQEIAELVGRTPGLDYLDIANALNLDLAFTVEACNSLVKDGEIREQKAGAG